MKNFEITYITKGRKEKITVQAITKAEALRILKSQKKVIISSIIEKGVPLSEQWVNFKKTYLTKHYGTIKQEALIAAFRQIAVMSGAGIPFNDILNEAAESTPDPQLSALLKGALDDINGGLNFSEALAKHRSQVGSLTISMIELGEKTGQMAESITTLADILEEISNNRAKIKKALRYPLMTLSAMGIAFTILIMFVVPKFKDTFDQLGAELPMPTKILLGIESALSHYGIFIAIGIVSSIVFIRRYHATNESFRLWFDEHILKLYLIGDIIYYATITRFTIVFGELIRAGLPLSESIITATGIVDNAFMRMRLGNIVVAVQRGITLTQALRDTEMYERMTVQMISAGESSGSLDTMFKRVADYYRMKFNNIVDNISSYIEPILIFMIASLVTLLALGIFMPIWGLAQAAQGH